MLVKFYSGVFLCEYTGVPSKRAPTRREVRPFSYSEDLNLPGRVMYHWEGWHKWGCSIETRQIIGYVTVECYLDPEHVLKGEELKKARLGRSPIIRLTCADEKKLEHLNADDE